MTVEVVEVVVWQDATAFPQEKQSLACGWLLTAARLTVGNFVWMLLQVLQDNMQINSSKLQCPLGLELLQMCQGEFKTTPRCFGMALFIACLQTFESSSAEMTRGGAINCEILHT